MGYFKKIRSIKNFFPTVMNRRKDHSPLYRLLSDIMESIRGTDLDFTRGRLGRAILLLSVPMILEMVMESVFALADIFFVSKLGSDAVATVGITESLMTLIYALGAGLGVGTTALVSRRAGEKDRTGISTAATQAIFVGFLVSLPIALAGIFFSRDFLQLMGASREITGQGYRYTSIMIGGNLVIMWLFIINAVFRSAGDAAISLRVLVLANGLNLILDPLFIFGPGPFPEWGIEGAAIATTTGRGLAVLYQFFKLYRGSTRVRIRSGDLKPAPAVAMKLVRLSAGGIGQNIIATSSWIGLIRIIAEFGSEVLAGYTIAIRIVLFSMLPAWGLSNAAATLTGQNLGARQPRRAERSVWLTSRINMIFLGLVALFLIINPAFLIRLFIDEPRVIENGGQCLRIISYGFVFYALGMVMVQAFNGAGDTFTPTLLNLICFWIIEIPLAAFLAFTLGMNQDGVYTSIVLSESLMSLLAWILFRRGKWKLRHV